MATPPDPVIPPPSVLIAEQTTDSQPSYPVEHLQRRLETPPGDKTSLDWGDRLLALPLLFVAVTLKLVCPDKMLGHAQVCRVLDILQLIFLPVHIGAAFATCGMFFISLIGEDAVSSRRLQLVWALLFGLGLFCIPMQVALYAWVIGNPVTATMSALLSILCFLPGVYIVKLITKYPIQRRGIEE